MRFKVQIFIPTNVIYKVLEIEAESIVAANEAANTIFRAEFEKTHHKSGNYFVEQI